MEYIQIDKTSKEPIYLQLKHSIKIAIMNGTIKHMHQLPTEAELCDTFSVSVIVAKNAYDELAKEGLITRIKGKGTFVTTRHRYVVPLNEFYNLEQFSLNAKYEMRKKVILFDKIKYQPHVHDVLNLSPEDACFVAKLVIYLKNEPLLLQTFYLPEKYFLYLDIDGIEHFSLLELFEKESPRVFVKVKNVFKPYNLLSHEADLLKVENHAAAHYVRSYFLDCKDHIFAQIISIYPGETTQFEVLLNEHS